MTNAQPPGRRDGRAVVVYTALRAVILAGCLGLGWLAGLTGPVLIVAALLVSGVLSWFLLQRPRQAMSGAVERRVTRIQQRLDQRAGAEDAYVDALHAAEGTRPRGR